MTKETEGTYLGFLLEKARGDFEDCARMMLENDRGWHIKSSFVWPHDGAAKVVLEKTSGNLTGMTATFEFPASAQKAGFVYPGAELDEDDD